MIFIRDKTLCVYFEVKCVFLVPWDGDEAVANMVQNFERLSDTLNE